MTVYHLAQINIARAIDDLQSEKMRGFVERLDEINSLADNSKGFVWRLQTNEGDATAIQAYDDPRVIVNLSVWESLETLKTFVYESVHIELLQGKKNWFEKAGEKTQAMWWLPVGSIPTVEEGKEKLANINSNGSTESAFNFSRSFSAPG